MLIVKFVGIFLDIVLPRRKLVLGLWHAHLDEMTIGSTQSVGCVQLRIHDFLADFAHALKHASDLLI